MATGIGNLVANLTANTSGFTKGLNQARSSLSGFASFAASSMASFMGNVGASAFTSLTSSLINTGKSALSLAADNEQLGISFTTMLGSAEESAKLIGSLQKFGAETPFETKDINPAARSLLAFGVAADQIVPTLRVLGDIAAGTNQPLGELSEIFGKAKVQGRLFQEDINQLTGRGIPVIQEFAKQFGVSTDQVRKLVEDGKIGFPQLQQALASLSGEGGKFSGLMQAQSQSLSGLWSTAKDNVTLALTDIGRAIVDGFDLKSLLSDTMGFAEMFRSEWLPSIIGTVNTLGQSFQRIVASIREGWGKWIIDGIAGFAEFVSNIDLYAQIAYAEFGKFVWNSFAEIDSFFTNIGIGLDWFGQHWHEVLLDVFNATRETFSGMFDITSAFFGGVVGGDIGKQLDPNFKPMEEGFKSAITELPKFTKAQIAETTPELEALYNQLGKRMQQAQFAGMKPAGTPTANQESEFQIDKGATTASKGGEKNAPGLALKGTKEALSNIFAANRVGKSNDPQVRAAKAAEQQVEEQRKTNTLIDKLVGQSAKTGEMVAIPL